MARLNQVAAALACHPRSVARAIAGRVDAKWTPDSDPWLGIKHAARKLRCRPEVLRRVLHGRDSFISQEKAAAIVGLSPRQFRKRRDVAPAVKVRGIVRYSLRAVVDQINK